MFPFEIDKMKEEVKKLEEETYKEGFWNDIEKAQKVTKKLSELKDQIEE